MIDTVLAAPISETIGIQGNTWPERAADAARLQQDQFSIAARQFSNLELARERAAFTRWKTIENLDKYLIEFESNFIKSGGKVIWAQDITDALESILEILKKSATKQVIKSKTNTATEIGLSSFLENQHIKYNESDTGDFIVQSYGIARSS
jgi:L-lactate utilization protein LutB